MNSKAPRLAIFPDGHTGQTNGLPGREFQELWFSLARKTWASLVLVPADHGASVATIATSLAQVGSQLRDTPVTAIVAESIDYGSARALTDLHQHVQDNRVWSDAIDVKGSAVAAKQEGPDAGATPVRNAQLMPPTGRVIVAIQPVVVEPLGVAIAHAADAVVLCIQMGATRMKSARRTIELIGPERIIGAFLIR